MPQTNVRTAIQLPQIIAAHAIANPKYVHTFRGEREKLVIPSRAKFHSCHGAKPDRPVERSSRRYVIVIVRKPIHAKSPFMNRQFSGSLFSASTTARSISRKSPTSSGK